MLEIVWRSKDNRVIKEDRSLLYDLAGKNQSIKKAISVQRPNIYSDTL